MSKTTICNSEASSHELTEDDLDTVSGGILSLPLVAYLGLPHQHETAKNMIQSIGR
jgi:hypothetical protein